jgi:hypothetical protein
MGAADDEAGGAMMPPKNPYDFVPFEGTPTYCATQPTAAQATGLTGTIFFELEVLTPLCIHQDPGQSGVRAFASLGNQPVIPATSLKGMLRSVHEVVTNSTLGLLTSKPRGWRDRDVPSAYRPGQHPERLTPSEALFGMVGTARGDEAVGHAGHLVLRDIPVSGGLKQQSVSRPQGGQPKPAHRSFYFTPQGQILGRKFYYHQHDYQRVLQVYASDRKMPTVKVESVPPGTRLPGQMQFFNLSEHTLADLTYALVLEWDAQQHIGLVHKLGYGKPLGLGSVRLSITRLLVERQEQEGQHIPSRFLCYGDNTLEDWTSRIVWLRDSAKSSWLRRRQGNASYQAFATIAHWPQTDNFIYPDFGFFRRERGATQKTTLWAYQGRATNQFYPHTPGTATTVQVGDQPPIEAVAADDPAIASGDRSMPPTPSVQRKEPPPPPMPERSPRRTGRLEQRGSDFVVIDEESSQEYPKIGEPPKKIKKQLRPGQSVRVSYHIATKLVDGQEIDVADDLRLAKDGN